MKILDIFFKNLTFLLPGRRLGKNVFGRAHYQKDICVSNLGGLILGSAKRGWRSSSVGSAYRYFTVLSWHNKIHAHGILSIFMVKQFLYLAM